MKVVCLKNNVKCDTISKLIEIKEINCKEQLLGLNAIGIIPEEDTTYHRDFVKFVHDRIYARFAPLFPNTTNLGDKNEIVKTINKLKIDFPKLHIVYTTASMYNPYDTYIIQSFSSATKMYISALEGIHQDNYYYNIYTTVKSFLEGDNDL